jgi:hypothetical protein
VSAVTGWIDEVICKLSENPPDRCLTLSPTGTDTLAPTLAPTMAKRIQALGFETAPSVSPSASPVTEAPSVSPTATVSVPPTVSPTTAPSSAGGCQDDPTAEFSIGDSFHNCLYLKGRVTPSYQETLCGEAHIHNLCKVTCGQCQADEEGEMSVTVTGAPSASPTTLAPTSSPVTLAPTSAPVTATETSFPTSVDCIDDSNFEFLLMGEWRDCEYLNGPTAMAYKMIKCAQGGDVEQNCRLLCGVCVPPGT